MVSTRCRARSTTEPLTESDLLKHLDHRRRSRQLVRIGIASARCGIGDSAVISRSVRVRRSFHSCAVSRVAFVRIESGSAQSADLDYTIFR